MKRCLIGLLTVVAVLTSVASMRAADENKKETEMHSVKDIVEPFYTRCLTVNQETNVPELMGNLLADNFQSIGSVETKSKEKLIGQLQFFWKIIPDLKWEIQEMLQDGNRVVVRSIASGSPKGDFMGLPTDGSRSFKIMAIDIHTVEDGKIVTVHHLEDWAVAMRQLKQ